MGKRHRVRPECGTRSGYDWHRRDGKELPCTECRQAEILYWREQRIIRGDVIRLNNQRRRARYFNSLGNNIEIENFTEQDILNRYGTDCHICKKPINLQAPRQVGRVGWENGLHLDHVIPLSKGGNNTIANIKPSHGYCNVVKNATIITEGKWVQDKLFDLSEAGYSTGKWSDDDYKGPIITFRGRLR